MRGIPAHHHPDRRAARVDAAGLKRPDHGGGMFLERPPGQAGLEEEGREEEVEVPGGRELCERKRSGKEGHGREGSHDPDRPLDAGRVAGRDPPPPDEPAEDRHRVIPGVRVPDQAIHQQRRGDYDRCRNHARRTPMSSAANAAAFTRSTRNTSQSA
ncbi:hypothetical protein DSECCO2_625690 [anaerobic digester metagenome]